MKTILKFPLVLALFLITNWAYASDDLSSKVIYGEDNRLDLYQVTDPAQFELAQSTVAIMNDTDLKKIKGGYEIGFLEYGPKLNLCKGERFYKQNAISRCSGFLVGPDLIVTAGHCVSGQDTCRKSFFVFGYGTYEKGSEPEAVPDQDVYSCKEIIVISSTDKIDHALIRLDRPVVGRSPLKIRRRGRPREGTPLVMIGHPSGLPTKVAAGAHIRSNHNHYFRANLDAYVGSSGSAVFNKITKKVEGILVRGENDFVEKDPGKKSCMISNVCKNNRCSGESVSRIRGLVQFIPEI